MSKRVVAIVGTYRKDRVIGRAVSEVLRGAEAKGAETKKIYLIDNQIEFCTNCRQCAQDKDASPRGKCIHDDDVKDILREVDSADRLVLGAPASVIYREILIWRLGPSNHKVFTDMFFGLDHILGKAFGKVD